jgi:hypothetical protein
MFDEEEAFVVLTPPYFGMHHYYQVENLQIK